jgi:hypothetical protein
MTGRQFLAFAAAALCSAATGGARCCAEHGTADFRFEIRPILAQNCFPALSHSERSEESRDRLRLASRQPHVYAQIALLANPAALV